MRLEPISWRELTGIVADGSERALGALGRTPEQIKGYWDYRDRVILQENASGGCSFLVLLSFFVGEGTASCRRTPQVGFWWGGAR